MVGASSSDEAPFSFWGTAYTKNASLSEAFMETNNKTTWAVGLGILVLVLLGGWLWWSGQTPSSQVATPKTEDEYALYVKDQRPSKVILVDRVLLKNGGFVAIHEMKDGKPGGVLGASYWLPAGESLNVPVTLLRQSIDKEQLWADLYADDGDKKFDQDKDQHIMIGTELVHAIFTVDATLPAVYDSKQ